MFFGLKKTYVKTIKKSISSTLNNELFSPIKAIADIKERIITKVLYLITPLVSKNDPCERWIGTFTYKLNPSSMTMFWPFT